MPVADNMTNRSVYPKFQKCYEDGTDCDKTGEIASISDITINGETLTSGWITFTSVGVETTASSSQTMTITPTYENISSGTYTIEVTYTTENGDDHTYTAINLSVGCTVASFTAPSNPADVTYSIFDDMEFFNMDSLTYTQSPECGYDYTAAYTWTGTNSYVKVDDDDSGQINIQSINPS